MASPLSTLPFESQQARSQQASALIRSLIALPELQMRLVWLEERLTGNEHQKIALALDEVASRSQLTDSAAREAILAIAVLFSKLRDSAWLWALRKTARESALINLERLLREPPASSLPAIETPEPKVPQLVSSRNLSVGERRSMARRPTRLQLEKLLHDPHPLVIEQLLHCPSLTEDDVITIVTRRPAYLPSLELVIQHARWIARRRVRMSLILNPGAPHGMALPFVMTCPREDLQLIFSTTTISATLRSVAHELYGRLPPIQNSASELHH